MCRINRPNGETHLLEIYAARDTIIERIVDEFGWCRSPHMFADAMAKLKPNNSLDQLLEKGTLDSKMEQWLKRDACQAKSVFD